jgi:NAD(P)-dependent dehydrogenase (short-subunit alcohol dehydrogenase family)
MQDKPVALVTGANKGIGRQTAKDPAAHRFTMLVGSCNLKHGGTAAKRVGADARSSSSSRSRIRAPSQPQQSASGTRRRDASSTYRGPADRSHGTRTRRPAPHSQWIRPL